MVKKILSTEELNRTNEMVKAFGDGINEYIESIKIVINALNDEYMAQAFYSSGKFGAAQKEKLEKIMNLLKKYESVVVTADDSLVVETQKYIAKLKELNNSGIPTSFNSGVPNRPYEPQIKTNINL